MIAASKDLPLFEPKDIPFYNKSTTVGSIMSYSAKKYNNQYVKDRETKDLELSCLIPAPDEYNIFSSMKQDEFKLLEMKFSILENGLFNPILVWKEKDGNNYIILSGHTRVNIYKELEVELRIEGDPRAEHFRRIPAIIYKYEDLTEEAAREIILDTNYIQRASVDKRYMPMLVQHRADIVKRQKDRRGKTLDIVAAELKIGRTSAYEDLTLASKVIEEIASYYYEGLLRKKNVIKFAMYNKDLQERVYRSCKRYFTNDRVSKLKKDMDYDTIYETLSGQLVKKKELVEVSFKVSAEYEKEFRRAVNKLIRTNKYK